MSKKFAIIASLLCVAMLWMCLLNWTLLNAAPGTVPFAFPTDVPPTESKPSPTNSKNGGGGGGGGGDGGGSRFIHCNSTIKGSVTNYGSMVPGSGVLVEVGASGWKSQTPADSNGNFSFNGLCKGTAFVRAVVPPGSLLTNPNAEVVLDGKNHVGVNLGFFPPLPQVVQAAGGPKPTAVPPVTSPSVPQSASPSLPAVQSGLVQPASLPRGVTVNLSAPRTVRTGMDAKVNISIQNGGPGNLSNAVVHIPLAAGVLLKEADTSRGALKMQVVPQALGKAGGVGAPLRMPASELVIDVGTLAPGDVVLIATKIRFENAGISGNRTEIQAEVVSDEKRYKSEVAVISLEETGVPFQVTLPTTGADNYLQYFQEFLW